MQLSSLLASAGLTGITAAQSSTNFNSVLNTTINSTSNESGSRTVRIDISTCRPPIEAFHITTTNGWLGSSSRSREVSSHSILEEYIHIRLARWYIILQRQRTHLLHIMPLQEDSITSQTAPRSEQRFEQTSFTSKPFTSCKTTYSGYLIQQNLQSASRKHHVRHRCAGGPKLVANNLWSGSILRNVYFFCQRTTTQISWWMDMHFDMRQMPQFLMENRLRCGFRWWGKNMVHHVWSRDRGAGLTPEHV